MTTAAASVEVSPATMEVATTTKGEADRARSMARSSRSGAVLYGNATAHGVANNDDRRVSHNSPKRKCQLDNRG